MKDQKRAPRLPAHERRAETVQVVLDLAAAENPAEITTGAIAERMHITQGALFRHFPTKDAIWQTVMEWVAERILARVDDAIQSSHSPLLALEAVFHAHIDFVAKHPGVPRILFGELQRAEDSPAKRAVRTLLRQYNERLQTLIEQGQSQGEMAPDVDTAAVAALFVGMIQGLVLQSLLTGKENNMRKKSAEVFSVYLRAIRRTP
jgi:TetR/AcrR family transcriptional regulator